MQREAGGNFDKRFTHLPSTDLKGTGLLLAEPRCSNDLAVILGLWQRTGCTGLYLEFSDLKMLGNLEMNAGHFEQISDCWSSEQRPATYYRTVAARARKLQADATTPRVRQYLDTMIAHCEQLAGKVEPGVSLSRSPIIGRSGGFMIAPRSSKSMTRSY
jgi:hypothetical protein